jgi:hypothetical protein
MIQVGAFALLKHQMNLSIGSIPTYRKGRAWFHRTKEHDKSFTDAVALGNLPSKFFLGKLRREPGTARAVPLRKPLGRPPL